MRARSASVLCLVIAAAVIFALPGAGPAAGSTSGLVAAYSFDEGSGSVLADASGNGHDGTISGATWTSGHDGGALSFNGTNASVDLGALGTFYQSGFTLEGWVQKSTTKKDVGVLGTWTTSGGPDDLDRPPCGRLSTHAQRVRPLLLPRLGPNRRGSDSGSTSLRPSTGARLASSLTAPRSRAEASPTASATSNSWRIGAYNSPPGNFFDGLDRQRPHLQPCARRERDSDRHERSPSRARWTRRRRRLPGRWSRPAASDRSG